ncbi:MAG: hypothetical protein M3Y04_02485 [Actinomycetota bacterium]|nr:hypothetical protein [Actinomycetota bacterium]
MDSHGSALLDESQPPGPIPSQSNGHPSRGLFFSQPGEDQAPEQSPPSTAEAAAGGSDSEPWVSEYADPSDVEPPTSTGSPAGESVTQLLSKKQMRQTAETAVKVGTGMAHTVAAKTPAQQRVGLYLADDDDAAAIGHPLADIMYRRGDIVGGKLSPDANDLLRSMMGVAGYFAKQVAKIGEVRQLEAGAAAGEVQQFPTEAA